MNSRRIPGCGLLLLAAGSIGAVSSAAQARPLTAREVIARIQAHVGVPWQQETVDTFKAGNPDTEVKGIAVTMMATFDVLQRAAAAGQNLIITHEPTFYNHLDKPEDLEHLASDLKSRLKIRVMRVVGDPKLKVRKAALVPGASGFGKETRALEMSDVQVLVTGEPREWETVEYVADAVTEGKPKALIILGHIPSEQA